MNDEILKRAFTDAMMIEIAALPDEDSPELFHVFSKRFEKKMKRIIREAERVYITVVGFKIRRAVLVALIASVFLTGCMSIKEIREPIIGFFIKSYERFSEVTFSSSDKSLDEAEFEYISPQAPDGYIIATESKLIELYEVEYKSENGGIIRYTQFDPSGASLSLDTQSIETENIIINDLTVVKYSKEKTNYLFWTDEKYGYTLVGSCDFSVLFDMVKSISPSDEP